MGLQVCGVFSELCFCLGFSSGDAVLRFYWFFCRFCFSCFLCLLFLKEAINGVCDGSLTSGSHLIVLYMLWEYCFAWKIESCSYIFVLFSTCGYNPSMDSLNFFFFFFMNLGYLVLLLSPFFFPLSERFFFFFGIPIYWFFFFFKSKQHLLMKTRSLIFTLATWNNLDPIPWCLLKQHPLVNIHFLLLLSFLLSCSICLIAFDRHSHCLGSACI